MRITIDESLRFMRQNPEIKDLLIQGLQEANPLRKRKSRIHATDEESQMFKKVWGSVQGTKIRLILERDLGASKGVGHAARLYFGELWRGIEKCEKEI